MRRKLIWLMSGILAGCGFQACAPVPSGPGVLAGGSYGAPAEAGLRSGDSAVSRSSIDAILNQRPGLATGWGEEQRSVVYGRSFERASSKPAGVDAIYYNNPQGITAMARAPQRVEGAQLAAGGLVEWGIKGRWGWLPAYKEWGSGRRLVAGSAKSNYRIALKNHSQRTLEAVVSVDGLDVMDGARASYSKRGYLIEPGASLEIAGFRNSSQTVAAFEFSSVASSYANLRHGDTRNVGVIGLAVFTPKGAGSWALAPNESGRRGAAQPFATAP